MNNIVGYVRLSRDEDKENYSSIIEQQNIIKNYANKHNLNINKIYIDDNYSGYSFNRPNFTEMIQELNKNKIKMIISKDLSRIGRKNGEVLVLLDKLKHLDVELILVEEGNDGFSLLNDNDDIIGIKTWYNEMYVKDISRKIRANIHSKQKTGEFKNGCPYGYLKKENKYYVDEKVAHVIKLIFKLYIEGNGYSKICKYLTDEGYLTPAKYKKKRLEAQGKQYRRKVTDAWRVHMIREILDNDFYIGIHRTHKTYAKHIKSITQRVKEQEQYVFPNDHESIISKETFKLAQEIKKTRNKTNYRGIKKVNYLFSGLLYCGNCGYKMSGRKIYSKNSNPDRIGYNCVEYVRFGNKYCSNHIIEEKKLIELLKQTLLNLKEQYTELINNYNIENNSKKINSKLKFYKNELDKENINLKLIYGQKIKDLMKETNNDFKKIIEENYTQMEDEKKNLIVQYKKQIKQLETINQSNIINKSQTNIDIIDQLLKSKKLTREQIHQIVDKITVYKDEVYHIDIQLKISIDKII